MPRYKILIEYDGTPFAGWQVQAEAMTVQGEIETAIEKLTGEKVTIQGAGRTDAGVHALGQVASFDLLKPFETGTIRDGLNAHLRPRPVAILLAEQMPDDFNARISAVQRHYLYRIVNRRPDLALERLRAWRVVRNLDERAMHDAAQRLIGHHDFTTFRSTECQAKSPMRTLDRFAVTREGDILNIEVSARSFLHNQVRSMVGSLALVGHSKWSADDLSAALAARNRTACGYVAPPQGLYLVKVDY